VRYALPARSAKAEAQTVGREHGVTGRLAYRVLDLGIGLVKVLERLLGLCPDLGLLGGLVLRVGTAGQQRCQRCTDDE